MRARVLPLLALASLALGACGDDFFPSYWIKEPRLIGVVADQPELDVGQKTTLHAIVANPTNEPIRYYWYRCDVENLASFGGDTATACVDPDRNQPYLTALGETAAVEVTMPDTPIEKLGIPDYTLGLYITVRVDIEFGDSVQRSIYRLRRLLPAPIPANTNPRLRGISIAPDDDAKDMGATAEMMPLPTTEPYATFAANDKIRLQVLFEDGSAEGYFVIDGDITKGEVKPATELLRTFWYTDYGTFSNPRTGEAKPPTELSLDKEKRRPVAIPEEGTVIHLWVMSHDERGGATTTEGHVRVLPDNNDLK